MKANTSVRYTALATSETNSKCAVNCILIDSIFIRKRRLRRGSFCQTCCWTLPLLFPRRKEFPSTRCGHFLLGAADLTRSLLLESPPLFARDSGPLRAQWASLEGTGSRSPQSISVRRAIDCARGRRWWGSTLMSDRWGTL